MCLNGGELLPPNILDIRGTHNVRCRQFMTMTLVPLTKWLLLCPANMTLSMLAVGSKKVKLCQYQTYSTFMIPLKRLYWQHSSYLYGQLISLQCMQWISSRSECSVLILEYNRSDGLALVYYKRRRLARIITLKWQTLKKIKPQCCHKGGCIDIENVQASTRTLWIASIQPCRRSLP